MPSKCPRGKYRTKIVATGETRCFNFRNFIQQQRKDGMEFDLKDVDYKNEEAVTRGHWKRQYGSYGEYRMNPSNFSHLTKLYANYLAGEWHEAGFKTQVVERKGRGRNRYSIRIKGRK